MKDFVNRVPTHAGRKKLTDENGAVTYQTIEWADDPIEEGTKLNRDAFMAIQGMENSTITFNSNGSITQTFDTGTLTVVFNSDGSISQTFVGNSGLSSTKTTKFNADGSISNTITN
jgi:hypothetical protein